MFAVDARSVSVGCGGATASLQSTGTAAAQKEGYLSSAAGLRWEKPVPRPCGSRCF